MIWHLSKNTLGRRILGSRAPSAVVIVRVLVGAVFLAEGVQKFLFPEALGVGRFAKVGIPWPEPMALLRELRPR